MKTHATPEELTQALREQYRENEALDEQVDIFARQLIVNELELLLDSRDWKTHELMPLEHWRQVKDRICWHLDQIRPSEEEQRDAWRELCSYSMAQYPEP